MMGSVVRGPIVKGIFVVSGVDAAGRTSLA